MPDLIRTMRPQLWRAFAGGEAAEFFSGPGDEHWTAGVDRMIDVLAPVIVSRALYDMADRIDRGPTFPIPPSVVSALVRERAADIEQGRGDDDA